MLQLHTIFMNFLVFFLTASTNRAERRVVSGSTKGSED
jgi:hypothetical protein